MLQSSAFLFAAEYVQLKLPSTADLLSNIALPMLLKNLNDLNVSKSHQSMEDIPMFQVGENKQLFDGKDDKDQNSFGRGGGRGGGGPVLK